MKTNFHKKNLALRLALKGRQTLTRKWPIRCTPNFDIQHKVFLKSRHLLPISNECWKVSVVVVVVVVFKSN